MAANSDDAHPFLATFQIDMRTALYGTTVKTNDIAEKQLQDIDLKKDLGRGLRSELGIHFAEQVLNKIDELNESVPGTRAAYEILCDYSHPNVGDLFATTLSYDEQPDRFGIKHITRKIGIGQMISSVQTADRVILSRIYELILKLVKTSTDDYERCASNDTRLMELARSATRKTIKNYKRTFKKNDRCLCGSGEPIFRCCGRGLLWRS
jgi:hypothetical protein